MLRSLLFGMASKTKDFFVLVLFFLSEGIIRAPANQDDEQLVKRHDAWYGAVYIYTHTAKQNAFEDVLMGVDGLLEGLQR